MYSSERPWSVLDGYRRLYLVAKVERLKGFTDKMSLTANLSIIACAPWKVLPSKVRVDAGCYDFRYLI